jgi:hypothetical protein
VSPADSNAELGRLTSVLLLVMGLLSLFQVGVVLEGWFTGTPFNPPSSPTEGIGGLQLLFAGTVCLWGLVVLVTAVLFLVWLSRTMRRQRASSASPPPARPWPARLARVLSLVVPYPQMKEAFAAEGTRAGDRDPQLELWLACVVLVLGIGIVQVALQGKPVGSTQSSGLFNALTCARELFLAAAAFLAARFVSELERRRARQIGPG